MDSDCLVIMMLKNPKTRPVKTRLALDIGEIQAREVYQELLHINLGVLERLESVHRLLSIDGDFSGFEQYGFSMVSQVGNDLENRILTVLTEEWPRYSRIILIGSDCPFITTDLIAEVFLKLKSVDVVLQPAMDGGYTLIGFSCNAPELFQGMPFSTQDLYRCTLDKINLLNYSCYELPQSFDIDTLDDWKRWKIEEGKIQ